MKKLIKEYVRLAGGRKRRVCDLECTDCGATFTCRIERLENQLKTKCGECWKQECIANAGQGDRKRKGAPKPLRSDTKFKPLCLPIKPDDSTLTLHPLYQTWKSMKARCYYPGHISYYRYGARGITVCDEWLNDFWMFVYHIGPKPSSGHSLDRIDNDYIYCPENVRWATNKEQADNRSN